MLADLIDRLATTDAGEAESVALALLERAQDDDEIRATLQAIRGETDEFARPTPRGRRASRILYWHDHWPSSSLRRRIPLLAALMIAEPRAPDALPGASEDEYANAVRSARDAHLLRYAIEMDALIDAPTADAPLTVVAFACDPQRPPELDALFLALRADAVDADDGATAWGAPGQSLREDVMQLVGQPIAPRDDAESAPARTGLLAPAPADGTVMVALSVLARFDPLLARAIALRWCFDPQASRRRTAWLQLARGPADLDLPFWRDRYTRELDAGVREAQLWALTRTIAMPLDTASMRALQRELVDAIPTEQTALAAPVSADDVSAATLPAPNPLDALVEALRVVARLGAGYAILADDRLDLATRAAIAPSFWHDAARAQPTVLIDVLHNAATADRPLDHRRLVTQVLAALVANGGAEAVLHSLSLPTSRARGDATTAYVPSGSTVRDACLRIRADTGVDVLADSRYPGVGYRRIPADLRARNVGEALSLLCELCSLRVIATPLGRVALVPATAGPDGVAWAPDPGSPPWLLDALGREVTALPQRPRADGEVDEPWTFSDALAAWSELLDATVVCPLHLRAEIDNRVRAGELPAGAIALPGRTGRPLRTELPEVLRPLGLDVVTRGPAVWIGTQHHVVMWKALDRYRRGPSPAALADLARSPACRWRVLTNALPDFAIEAAAAAVNLKPASSVELALAPDDFTDPRRRPVVFEFLRLAHIRSRTDAAAWWQALQSTRLTAWIEAATAALAHEFADNGQIAWLRGDACASMRHLLPYPPAVAYALEAIDEPRDVSRRGAAAALQALGVVDADRLWEEAGPALFWLERKNRDGLVSVLAPTATRARLTRLVRRYLESRALVLDQLAEHGVVITRATEQEALTSLDLDELASSLREAGLSVGAPRSTISRRAVLALAAPVDPERPPLQLVAPALSKLAAAALTGAGADVAQERTRALRSPALPALGAPVLLVAGPLTLGLAARLVDLLSGVSVAVGVTTAEVWREYPPAVNTVTLRGIDARDALTQAFIQLEAAGQPHRPLPAVTIRVAGDAGRARLFADLPDAAGPPVLVHILADLWPTMPYRARTDAVATLWQQTGARSVHRVLLQPGRRNRPDVAWAPSGTPELRTRLTSIARSGGVVAESPTAEPPASTSERAALTSTAFRLELRLAALVGSPFAQRHFPLLDWADVKYGDRLTMGKPRFRSGVFSRD